MCKQWNSDTECYEEGYYEDGMFVAISDDDIPDPVDDVIVDMPIGADALKNAWDQAK